MIAATGWRAGRALWPPTSSRRRFIFLGSLCRMRAGQKGWISSYAYELTLRIGRALGGLRFFSSCLWPARAACAIACGRSRRRPGWRSRCKRRACVNRRLRASRIDARPVLTGGVRAQGAPRIAAAASLNYRASRRSRCGCRTLGEERPDRAQVLTAARSSRLPRITFSASTTTTTASPNNSARQSLKISAMPPIVSSAMPR
jgi:hypothetical protein